MEPAFKQEIVGLLDAHRIMTIATNRGDGWPQATVVGYANDGLLIYCLVSRDSQKFANIARNSRVSITIANDYPQPLQIKGLSLAGRVSIVEERSEYLRAGAIMLRRYPEYASMPVPGPDLMPMLRITPEIVSILNYDKGFGHTDLVRVTADDLAEHIEARRHQWGISPAA